MIHDLRSPASRVSGPDSHTKTPATTARICHRLLWTLTAGFALSLGLLNAGAQATQATALRKADLQVGAYFSISPSPGNGASLLSGTGSFNGGGGYVTLDIAHNLGVDLNFHQVNGPTGGVYERTYEVGARYVKHYGILGPYVRASYGRGVFNYPNDAANLAYNLFAGGVGVDARLLKHVNFRADYDFQKWLNYVPGSLNPQLINFGAAYHF